MTDPPPIADAKARSRERGGLASWFGGGRVVLDDRQQPREVMSDPEGHADDDPNEPPPDVPAGPPGAASKGVGFGAAVLALGLPLLAGVIVAGFAWRWAGRVASAIGMQGTFGRIATAGLLVGVGVCCYLASERHLAHRSRRHAAVGIRGKRDEHVIRRTVGGRGLCYGCAYHIAPFPREPDGCVVCPECGAAWRVDDWANDGGRYELPHGRTVKPAQAGASGRPGWIADAREVEVPVLGHITDPGRSTAIRRRSEPRAADALGVKIAALLVALVAVWPLVYAFGQGPRPGLIVGLVVVLMLGLLVWRTRRVTLTARAKRLGDKLVADDRCPCCESPLRAEPSPIDGCLLCDACGSAWTPPNRSAAGRC